MDIITFFEVFMYFLIALLFAVGGYTLINLDRWREEHDNDY